MLSCRCIDRVRQQHRKPSWSWCRIADTACEAQGFCFVASSCYQWQGIASMQKNWILHKNIVWCNCSYLMGLGYTQKKKNLIGMTELMYFSVFSLWHWGAESVTNTSTYLLSTLTPAWLNDDYTCCRHLQVWHEKPSSQSLMHDYHGNQVLTVLAEPFIMTLCFCG